MNIWSWNGSNDLKVLHALLVYSKLQMYPCARSNDARMWACEHKPTSTEQGFCECWAQKFEEALENLIIF